MKKFIAGMLALVTVFAMTACSKDKGGEKKQEDVKKTEGTETPVVEHHDPISAEADDEVLDIAQKAMDAKLDYHFSGVLSLGHDDCLRKMAIIFGDVDSTVEELKDEFDVLAAAQKFEVEKDKGTFTSTGELGVQSVIQGEELTELQGNYAKNYKLTVTEAVRVEYTVKTEFESGTEETTESLVVVRIEDRWYLDLTQIQLL